MERIFDKKYGYTLGLSLLLCCIHLFLVYSTFKSEIWTIYNHGRWYVAIAYIIIALLSEYSIARIILSTKNLIRDTLLLIYSFSLTLCCLIIQVTGDDLNAQSWSTIYNNIDQTTSSSFVSEYLLEIFSSILIGMLVFWLSKKVSLRKSYKTYSSVGVFICTILICIATTQYSNGNKTSYSPIHKTFSSWFYYIYNPLYEGKRLPVKISVKGPQHNNIWLIVDESIRYDYFDLAMRKQDSIIANKLAVNYSPIASGAVCSDYANALLAVGVKPRTLPDTANVILKLPSLFHYAKKAGYKTIWVNTYSEKPGTYGFFNQSLIEAIDTIITQETLQDNTEYYEFDTRLLKNVLNTIEDDEQYFIYINKIGCHYPYKGYTKPKDRSDQDEKAYEDCVTSNLRNYLPILADQLKKNSTVYYTSDHGQHLGENPNISLTHCARKEVDQSMAEVPYMILSKRSINSTAKQHASVFYDVLNAMGYPSKPEQKNEEIYFSSGDIFGRTPVYIHRFEQSKIRTR